MIIEVDEAKNEEKTKPIFCHWSVSYRNYTTVTVTTSFTSHSTLISKNRYFRLFNQNTELRLNKFAVFSITEKLFVRFQALT